MAEPAPRLGPFRRRVLTAHHPERYRIVGARIDAWLLAFEANAITTTEHNIELNWDAEPVTTSLRIDRVAPTTTEALPLIVARSCIGDPDIDDIGVALDVADPAICVGWFPHCGCDACDDGSQV